MVETHSSNFAKIHILKSLNFINLFQDEFYISNTGITFNIYIYSFVFHYSFLDVQLSLGTFMLLFTIKFQKWKNHCNFYLVRLRLIKVLFYSDSSVLEAWTWFCESLRSFIMYSMNVSAHPTVSDLFWP